MPALSGSHIIKIITFLFNVVLGVSLALTWGALGIVVATILAELLQYLMSMLYVKIRITSVKSLPKPLLMQFASGLVMYVAVIGTKGVVSFRGWTDLVTVLVVGATTYGLCLFLISPAHRFTAYSIYKDAAS